MEPVHRLGHRKVVNIRLSQIGVIVSNTLNLFCPIQSSENFKQRTLTEGEGFLVKIACFVKKSKKCLFFSVLKAADLS
jgi:hypothetical protein